MPSEHSDTSPELTQDFNDSVKAQAEKVLNAPGLTLREDVEAQNFPFAMTAIAGFFQDVLDEDYSVRSTTALPVEFTLGEDQDSHTILIGFQVPPKELRQNKDAENFAGFVTDLHAAIKDLQTEEIGEQDIARPSGAQYADAAARTLSKDYEDTARKEQGRILLGGIGLDPLSHDEIGKYTDTENMAGVKLTVTHIEDFVKILRKMHERHMFWSHPEYIQHNIEAPFREPVREMIMTAMLADETALYDMHANKAYTSKDEMLVDFVRSTVQIRNNQHLGHRYSLDDLDQFVAMHQVRNRRTLEMDKPAMWLQ